MSETTYTICEYNMKTKQYKELATVTAASPTIAKALYMEQAKWRKRKGFSLLAKPPICR